MKRLLCIGLCILTGFVGIGGAALAAPVSSVSLRMSRQSISTATNIELRFITADAVSDTGDTIVLDFADGFSLAGVTIGDIGLSHGPVLGSETVEVVASPAAAGQWSATISPSIHRITLTPPSNVAVGEIAAGEQVIIRIGQNVTGGSNQITTPSSVGQYSVTVGGGFAGFATIYVPIVALSGSRFTVGFTVPASSGGSSGSSGGGDSGGGGVGAAGGGSSAAGGGAPAAGGGATAGGGDAASGGSVTGGTAADGSPSTAGGTAADGSSSAAGGTAAGGGSPVAGGSAAGGGATSGSGTSAAGGATSGGAAASGSMGGGSTSGGGSSGGGGGVSAVGGAGAAGTAGASTTVVAPTTSTPPFIPTAPLQPEPTTSTPASPMVPIVSIGGTSGSVTEQATPVQYMWRIQGLGLATGLTARPRVLPGDEFELSIKHLDRAWSGWVEVGGSRYALLDGEGERRAVIRAADTMGVQSGTLHLFSERDPEQELPFSYEVVAPYRVTLKEAGNNVIEGVTLTVLTRRGRSWSALGDAITLGASGVFARYLPAGTYRIEVRKKDWRVLRQEITLATAGPVTGQGELDKELQNPLAVINEDAGITENAAAVARATVDAVQQMIEQARTPETTAVAEVAAPVAVAVGVTAATAAASSFNILAYLRFLITQPALLIRRRKREKWGLVYNAITKQPVDLAIVRLVDHTTGVVKQTRITDAQGRFAFLTQAGRYRFQVVKPGFAFPSVTLAKATIDLDLVDLYHGEEVQVEGSATLTPNIPLDPLEKMETPASIVKKRYWRRAQGVLSIGSLVVAAAAFVLQPTMGMGIFAVAQVGAFLLFRRLAVPPKPKNWGIVYDAVTRKPIARAVVRIFDKQYNKLLETQLTDPQGKYAFFAGKNVYYVTADVAGYERYRSPDLDLRSEAMAVVREPLALKPTSAASS